MGYGVAALGNLYRVVAPEDAHDAVDAAWEAGVRYFDTAPHYGLGLAEERLGEALASRPRADYILSSKVGRILVDTDAYPGEIDESFQVERTRERRWDFSRDGILRSIEDSLARLGTDRLDVVFVHDPDDHYREALETAFPALEQLRAEGVITSYGAGMNQSVMLADVVTNTDLDVVMVAGRYSLLEQSALDDLLPIAAAKSVSVVAAAVFNSGLLAKNRPDPESHYNYETAPSGVVERVNRIADVCEAHGVSLPAAAAQFALSHPAVSTVCLGARSRSQIERNAALFDVAIPQELWDELISADLLREGWRGGMATD